MQVIFEVFFLVVCYWISRLLVPVLTFGRVHVETFAKQPFDFPWHGMHRLPDGRIVIHSDLASIIGLILIALLGIAAAIIYVRLAAT